MTINKELLLTIVNKLNTQGYCTDGDCPSCEMYKILANRDEVATIIKTAIVELMSNDITIGPVDCFCLGFKLGVEYSESVKFEEAMKTS